MSRPRVPLTAWSRTELGQPVVSIQAVEVNGKRVFVRSYAVTSDGYSRLGQKSVPVIVLVHGIGVSAHYFIPLIRNLTEFADVLAVDLPGFSTLPAPEESLGMDGFAKVVREVIHRYQLHDPIILGHSMGAYVVVAAVTQEPSLSGRILLLDPPANSAEYSATELTIRFGKSAVLEPLRVGAVAIPAYLSCGPHWFREVLPAMLRFPLVKHLHRLNAVTMFVRGAHDYVCPHEWLETLAAATAGSTVMRTVSDAAHSVMFQHHSEVSAYLFELAATVSPCGGVTLESTQRDQIVNAPAGNEVAAKIGFSSHWVRRWRQLVTQGIDGFSVSVASKQWRQIAAVDYRHVMIRYLRALSLKSLFNPRLTVDTQITPYPVYFLSGMTQTWRVWKPLMRRLAAGGCEVKAVKTLGRSLGSILDLAKAVEYQLIVDDATDVVIVAHSKGGLVAKQVLLGPEGWRIRRVIAAGTPWHGSSLVGLAPWWSSAQLLNAQNHLLHQLNAHKDVNGRIWTVSAAYDQQVPNGTQLLGARNIVLSSCGHNQLTDGVESMETIERLIHEDSQL